MSQTDRTLNEGINYSSCPKEKNPTVAERMQLMGGKCQQIIP